jgi:hypothetical protein
LIGRWTQELLRVRSPLGLQASLEALEGLKQREPEPRHPLAQQLAQRQYAAQRAWEQYPAVDPRYRLVAAALERRWNAKRAAVEAVQATWAALPQPQRALTDGNRTTIRRLGERCADVWDSPHGPMEWRKTSIRTVGRAVMVNEDVAGERWRCGGHGHGGSPTSCAMPTPQWGIAEKPAPDPIELLRPMALRSSAEESARVLNQPGRRPGKGHRWTTNRVGAARRRSVSDGRRRPGPAPDVLSRQQAAR